MALPGIGPLQESLAETNRLLAAVLAELRRTNTEGLPEVAHEIKSLNTHLGGRPRE